MLTRTLKALKFEYTDQLLLLGVAEDELVEKVTGIKIKGIKDPAEKMRKTCEALDVDMIYELGRSNVLQENKQPKPGCGYFENLKEGFPYTDAFHVAYKGLKLARSESASQLWVIERPFKTYEELLKYLKDYDPREDELRSIPEIAQEYKETYQTYQEVLKDITLVAGEFYLTLFTYLIIHIGWPMLVRLAFRDSKILDDLLAKYSEVAKKHVEAWSRIGIKVFFSHDDIAHKDGLFFPVTWFRKHIKPLWREIWKPIKDKGIKLVYISDGDYQLLMDDIIDAGADGFHILWDPRFSHEEMEQLVEKYGKSKILLISPSYKVLTYGKEEAIAEAGCGYQT